MRPSFCPPTGMIWKKVSFISNRKLFLSPLPPVGHILGFPLPYGNLLKHLRTSLCFSVLFSFNFQNIKIFCSLFLTQTRYQVSSCFEAFCHFVKHASQNQGGYLENPGQNSTQVQQHLLPLFRLCTFINTCQQHSPFLFYQTITLSC